MTDSPMSASPYQVLGVAPGASEAELKSAYRRRLRETHPDTGGSALEFQAVQSAWERIGTASARAAFDSGRGSTAAPHPTWAPAAPRPRADSRPQARASGHPGGWNRERYLEHMREWMGRGTPLDDPYEPRLVQTAPREIRHLLAAAIAEESTARELAGLGIGFTIWHDVATPAGKIDHVVLGPTGLWAVQSEDWGAPVRVKRGELIGEGIDAGDRPIHDLASCARQLARAARVKFSALVMVVPDGDAPESLVRLGSTRGMPSLLVEHPRLPAVLRSGIPGVGTGGTDLFEVRTRLQQAVRFV